MVTVNINTAAVLTTVITSLIIGQESVFDSNIEGTRIVVPESISGLGIKNQPEEFHFFPFGCTTISSPSAELSRYPPACSI
ncbi:MAG TPA: hypothetical protein VLN45_02175 [Ignavibacteriaceae bacterium]|nr:hypothetical protein [Ignavibacteriaceae bacterium]